MIGSPKSVKLTAADAFQMKWQHRGMEVKCQRGCLSKHPERVEDRGGRDGERWRNGERGEKSGNERKRMREMRRDRSREREYKQKRQEEEREKERE